MKEENQLDALFAKAKNEPIETNIREVYQWVGYSSLGVFFALLWMKLKSVFYLKSIIMMSTTAAIVAIAAAAYLYSGGEEKKSIQPTPNQDQVSQQVTNHQILDLQTKSTVEKSKEHSPASEESIKRLDFLEAPSFGTSNAGIIPTAIIAGPREEKEVGEFSELRISGATVVVIEKGDKCAVRLEGDESAKSRVLIRSKDNTLDISSKNSDDSKNANDSKVTIYVTMRDLDKIQCSGASNVEVKNEFKTEDFELVCSGASVLNLSLKLTSMTMKLSGASLIKLNGTCQQLEMESSGASSVKAPDFVIQDAEIKASGASSTVVNVQSKLSIKVSGASSVKYKGSPTVDEQQVTGASSVKRLKE